MSISDSISFRLEQAHETLKEAETLEQNGLYRGAINRAYYAMFYSVLALAAKKSIVISKHTGIISFFDKEYVKTGVFPSELSRVLHIGFDRRQSNDYGEVWSASGEEVEIALSEARLFVEAVRSYLQKD